MQLSVNIAADPSSGRPVSIKDTKVVGLGAKKLHLLKLSVLLVDLYSCFQRTLVASVVTSRQSGLKH